MNIMSNDIPNGVGHHTDIRYIRKLADILDLHVGVSTRKQILEGNERLTLGTDDHSWAVYFTEVMTRLDATIDEEKRIKIFIQTDHAPDEVPIEGKNRPNNSL